MAAPLKLSSRPTQEYWEIPVLFEDDHLLALDKPSQLLTSPDRYDPARPNLMGLLHAGIRGGAPWARSRGLVYLSNAHRLEPETSGVLLLAKSKPVLIALADLFGSERPTRTYLALIHGIPPEPTFEIDAKLAPHPHRVGVMRVDPKGGKRSITSFQREETFGDYALLRCLARTSRIHQISAHLQYARLPVVGDRTYGGKPLWLSRLKRTFRLKPGHEERALLGRVALHALTLELPHPITGDTVRIESPWPKDLRVAVKYLRLFAGSSASAADGDRGFTSGAEAGRGG